MTYGNGKVLTQSHDQDYRLSAKSIPGVTDLSYGYTLRNNIDAINNTLDISKNQALAYDSLQRLSGANGDYGVQTYSFDAIGNRLTKTQDSVTDTYTYNSVSHHLQSVGATNLTYDAIGNTLTKGDLTFTYNQTGRLVSATKTGMAASYDYNAQGERVKKTVDGVSTLFHYDQAGQLMAETDALGGLLQEYIYLDGVRLATLVPVGTTFETFYVHTDHLGSPIALTDSVGAIQWQGSYDPYGTVTVDIDNVSQKLRFPGQYADAETGLHYNYFRDYDPSIGRYIQSDPIGLGDGTNTYAYVANNPLNYIDPTGLGKISWCIRKIHGAWKEVTKNQARRQLQKGKDIKVSGAGSSQQAKQAAREQFGNKTTRHDGHGNTGMRHYQHKNGGRGHVFYSSSIAAFTFTAAFGENIFTQGLDFINPVAELASTMEVLEEIKAESEAASPSDSESCNSCGE